MRCYIKNYIFSASVGGSNSSLLTRTYQGEDWEFSGKIKYQRDEHGSMRVSFEIIYITDEEPIRKEWYESFDFDFDESTAAVIVDCNTKNGL